MSYLNLDDNFADHPRVISLTDGAFRLHVSGLCYCVAHETGWVVVGPIASRLTPKFRSRYLAELVRSDLWRRHGLFDYQIQPLVSYATGKPLWKTPAVVLGRPKIPDELRQAVYARDGHACLHCRATERLTLDHVHPFSLGGGDTFENLQTLCQPCNSRKGARV